MDLKNSHPAAPEFHDPSTTIVTFAIVTVEMEISWGSSSSHLSTASADLAPDTR
jgi:hypothetical protein